LLSTVDDGIIVEEVVEKVMQPDTDWLAGQRRSIRNDMLTLWLVCCVADVVIFWALLAILLAR
jgi:hypothetical protein